MALPRLKPEARNAQRDQLLSLIQSSDFEIRRDLECGYTLHEVIGEMEIALRPATFIEGDYLRCYTAITNPGKYRLVIDDVIFDEDKVTLDREIFWNQIEGGWDDRPISQIDG